MLTNVETDTLQPCKSNQNKFIKFVDNEKTLKECDTLSVSNMHAKPKIKK